MSEKQYPICINCGCSIKPTYPTCTDCLDKFRAEGPTEQDDYAYKDIKEYEDIVQFKVNEAFRVGWDMARTTNKMLAILANPNETC